MAAFTEIGPYEAGEKQFPLVVTMQDSAGAALNLTGYSANAVWKDILTDGATATTETSEATITDAANGQVTYTWSTAVHATAGTIELTLWVGNASNRRLASKRFRFEVVPALAAAPAI